jgi:outer membrane protein insertion porin family
MLPHAMTRWKRPARLLLMLRVFCALCAAIALAPSAVAQQSDLHPELIDRPISSVSFQGLRRVSEQEVRNNIRAAVGEPYDPETVGQDVQRLTRLGQFKYIEALLSVNDDGSVAITYVFVEQQIITERQVVGNRLIADADLLAIVQVVPRGPRDDFLIQAAKRGIERLYKERGHYLTTVQIDESELDTSGLLIFRVIEGPRVKVRALEFEGNESFHKEQLEAEVHTRPAMFLFRKGELDEDVLSDDVAALVRFYEGRGYLDARVDRRIDLSPDTREAKVVFVIAEGDQYRLRTLRVRTPDGSPPKVFSKEQIAAIIELKTGDVYSDDLRRKSVDALRQAYGLLGYVDIDLPTAVRTNPLRVPDERAVDLDITINEGQRYLAGEVRIGGHDLTRDNVVRRELRGLEPGLPIDATQIIESENRLRRTRLFSDARITVQAPDPEEPAYRDVLVEVKERNTGSVNFGVAVGSDAGVFGELSLEQRNFDISDWPESLDELLSGRAFRGAGQHFNMAIRPGTELFQYVASWTDPRLFDSDYSLTVSGQYRSRFYDLYDEDRVGASVALGRRFGDIWTGSVRTRLERVELANIEDDAPTAIFDDAGPNTITALGLSLTRTTISTVRRPGSGSRLELAIDRFGALGGDIDFTSVSADYTVFLTLNEDFLGRKSTLKLSTRAASIFDGNAPVYESLYLGGRTLRGFDFRTVSPKGVRFTDGTPPVLVPSDEPIGGDWLFFAGAQYEVPVWEDNLTFVLFCDSGTVLDDPGFEDYRVSLGAGLRIYIPQFGDIPIALDFAFPVLKEETDEEQFFSFSAELPF